MALGHGGAAAEAQTWRCFYEDYVTLYMICTAALLMFFICSRYGLYGMGGYTLEDGQHTQASCEGTGRSMLNSMLNRQRCSYICFGGVGGIVRSYGVITWSESDRQKGARFSIGFAEDRLVRVSSGLVVESATIQLIN